MTSPAYRLVYLSFTVDHTKYHIPCHSKLWSLVLKAQLKSKSVSLECWTLDFHYSLCNPGSSKLWHFECCQHVKLVLQHVELVLQVPEHHLCEFSVVQFPISIQVGLDKRLIRRKRLLSPLSWSHHSNPPVPSFTVSIPTPHTLPLITLVCHSWSSESHFQYHPPSPCSYYEWLTSFNSSSASSRLSLLCP